MVQIADVDVFNTDEILSLATLPTQTRDDTRHQDTVGRNM